MTALFTTLLLMVRGTLPQRRGATYPLVIFAVLMLLAPFGVLRLLPVGPPQHEFIPQMSEFELVWSHEHSEIYRRLPDSPAEIGGTP